MYGLVTRNEAEVSWAEFDRAFYEMKDVTGRATEPVPNAVNTISCFADNAAVEGNPDVASISEDGKRATRERRYFDWDHVCPTHEEYRRGLLEMIEEAAGAGGDVRLDDAGFARGEYCHCDRCDRRFADSGFDSRAAWRGEVITEFVATARERVPGDLLVTLYPDPYPGHLYERNGVDLDAIADYADEFVVPLYDMAYSTTYWIEAIASGFADRLSAPLAVELYAVDVDIDDLIRAVEVAGSAAETVLFGYDASTARATLRRMRADRREGVTHGRADEDGPDRAG